MEDVKHSGSMKSERVFDFGDIKRKPAEGTAVGVGKSAVRFPLAVSNGNGHLNNASGTSVFLSRAITWIRFPEYAGEQCEVNNY